MSAQSECISEKQSKIIIHSEGFENAKSMIKKHAPKDLELINSLEKVEQLHKQALALNLEESFDELVIKSRKLHIDITIVIKFTIFKVDVTITIEI